MQNIMRALRAVIAIGRTVSNLLSTGLFLWYRVYAGKKKGKDRKC